MADQHGMGYTTYFSITEPRADNQIVLLKMENIYNYE